MWGRRPPYKLLDCGSANGLTLKAFAKMKVDAWGIENNEYIHSQTPKKWRSRNLKGDVRKLPFAEELFDFVYETCLCYLPEDSIDDAIRELFRICRIGVVCGSIATDMTSEIIESGGLVLRCRDLCIDVGMGRVLHEKRISTGDSGPGTSPSREDREAIERRGGALVSGRRNYALLLLLQAE